MNIRAALREPLVHFLAIGALLFLVVQWWGGGPGSSRIVITPGQIDALVVGFTRTWQRPPTERELKGLIDDYVLGALTAADRRLPVWSVVALAAFAGAMHGWLNGAAIAEAGNAPLGLVGIASAIFVLAALLAALVVSLRADWTRIIVCVAGSWIAAVGLLMLGWAIRQAD